MTHPQRLADRQGRVLQRLRDLEGVLALRQISPDPPPACPQGDPVQTGRSGLEAPKAYPLPSSASANTSSHHCGETATLPTLSWGEAQRAIAHELQSSSITFKFYEAPAEYYDMPLEDRRKCLGAPTTQHLCKTLTMRNTKHRQSAATEEGMIFNPEYFCVVVQVNAPQPALPDQQPLLCKSLCGLCIETASVSYHQHSQMLPGSQILVEGHVLSSMMHVWTRRR